MKQITLSLEDNVLLLLFRGSELDEVDPEAGMTVSHVSIDIGALLRS